MNAGNGTPCDYPITGGTGTCDSSTNQLGRIEIAVAPSNPNYIYAQAQSIVWNRIGGCGRPDGSSWCMGHDRWRHELDLYGRLSRRCSTRLPECCW